MLETVAVLGEIDHVGRGAEDRNVGAFQRLGELERGLAAELDDDAVQRAVRALGVDDLEHVLGRERLEIEPVRGVVIGRDRFRIAVDHDGLVAGLAQRKGGVAAAIVELDALADAVRPAAEDHDLFPLRGGGLVGRRARERRLVGGIHVGGGRGELGGAGVDALEHRTHPERAPRRAHLRLAAAGEDREPRVREAHGLEAAEGAGARRQAFRPDLGLGLDDAADLGEEPGIDLARGVDLLVAEPEPHRLRDLQQPVRGRRPERRPDRVAVVALAEALDHHLVEPGEAGLERAQRLLQALLEGAADRHRLAHRFHRRGEHRLGAGEFLEREARHLGDDVVDGRLEARRRRPAGDVVGDLVEGVADG